VVGLVDGYVSCSACLLAGGCFGGCAADNLLARFHRVLLDPCQVLSWGQRVGLRGSGAGPCCDEESCLVLGARAEVAFHVRCSGGVSGGPVRLCMLCGGNLGPQFNRGLGSESPSPSPLDTQRKHSFQTPTPTYTWQHQAPRPGDCAAASLPPSSSLIPSSYSNSAVGMPDIVGLACRPAVCQHVVAVGLASAGLRPATAGLLLQLLHSAYPAAVHGAGAECSTMVWPSLLALVLCTLFR
jgi:hypothetical protein